MKPIDRNQPQVIEDAVKLLKSDFVQLYVLMGFLNEDASIAWHSIRTSTKGRELMMKLYAGKKHIQALSFITDYKEEAKMRLDNMKTEKQTVTSEQAGSTSATPGEVVEQGNATVASTLKQKLKSKIATKQPPVVVEEVVIVEQEEEEQDDLVGEGEGEEEEIVVVVEEKKSAKKEKTPKAAKKKEKKAAAVKVKKVVKKKDDDDRGNKTAIAKKLIAAGETNVSIISEKSGAAVAYVRTLMYNLRKAAKEAEANKK